MQQGLRHVNARDEHDDGGGGKRDDRRFDAERAVAHEADDHAHEHDDRNLQQAHVFDLLFRIELEHAIAVFVGNMQAAAIQEVEHHEHDGQNHAHDRRVDDDEVEERVASGRADHDVRRIADEGRRAADVRRHDFNHEERNRVHLEQLANGKRHGADEQHRGDVVEECRKHGREQHIHDHDVPRVALGDMGGFDGQVAKHARLLHDSHKQHHAEQHANGVEVNMRHSLVERHNVRKKQHGCATNGDERTMHLFRHHERDDDKEHRNSEYCVEIHRFCVSS